MYLTGFKPPRRYLLFMKMAALQLMQQKAKKDTKTDTPAITETSGMTPESNTDTTQTRPDPSGSPSASEVSTDSTSQTDNSTSAASQAETVEEEEENTSKPTTNGPVDLTATQNGECKSPITGKDLEESIPGLAQAKELAETLVAEDGSCIGMSKNTPKHASRTTQGELLWWIIA